MARFFFLCTAMIAALGTSPALCAPQGLLDKTVTMSWSTSGSGTRADGTAVSFSNINTRVVYISTAGRTFLRMEVKSSGRRGAARSADKGPGEGSSKGSVRLDGNRLVGTEAFASGARQYVATFDPGFSSCTLSVIDAKSGGAKISRRGPDGTMYVIDSVSTGSPTCSVRSGNAFSGN
ncbi:hypothetical protein [Bradyrhizobium sp.]|uniref:hypothetical protein n=1 Tax=Bradyrhizobium sp. TaxID=376 RepID=UPI0027344310|nr:hypothetical protein [Bradyrhizobium sp.]MDP3074283.1 hypothetical protein [Bradyrhizobium sp.]